MQSKAMSIAANAPLTGRVAFSPEQLNSGISLFLKANTKLYSDAGFTPCVNGSAVQQWNDLSGNSNNAVQSTVADRPQYQTGVIHNRPGVDFNQTVSTHLTLTNPIALTEGHIFIVCYLDDVSGTHTVLSGTVGSGADFGSQDADRWRTTDDGGTTLNSAMTDVHNQDNAALVPYILELVISTTDEKIYRNGVLTRTRARAGHAFTFDIIGNTPVLNNSFNGVIGSVLIWSRILTDSEAQNVRSYLGRQFRSLWVDGYMAPLVDQPTQVYQGVAHLGLWGGTNTMPANHQTAGVTARDAVRPLDAAGAASASGKVGFIIFGPSNAFQAGIKMESAWSALPPTDKYSRLVLVNGAIGGAPIDQLVDNTEGHYTTLASTVSSAGLTAAQVQVVLMEHGIKGTLYSPTPITLLPDSSAQYYDVITYFGDMVRYFLTQYPNVKVIWVASPTHSYNTALPMQIHDPPERFEAGIALIRIPQLQHRQRETAIIDTEAGDLLTGLPWMGTDGMLYNWTVREQIRLYDLFQFLDDWFAEDDGSHLNGPGREEIGERRWLAFMRSNSLTTAYFVGPVLVSDTFTGTSGTQMTAHSPDVNLRGNPWANAAINGLGPGAFTDIQSNQARPFQNNRGVVINVAQHDVVISFDWVTAVGVNNRNAIVARYVDTSNMIRLRIRDSGDLTLFKQIAAVDTTVAQVTGLTITKGNTYRVKLYINGTSYRGYIDGVEILTGTITEHATATKHGFINSGGDPATRIDNLTIQGT